MTSTTGWGALGESGRKNWRTGMSMGEVERAYGSKGPKYEINVEGAEYAWEKDTITVPEIRSLGGIPDDQQIVEVFDDNSEQTLAEDAVIEVKPGKGFGKKVKFQRG